MSDSDLLTTSKLDRKRIRADFRNFIWVAFQFLRIGTPTIWQFDAAWWMQHGPEKIVLECWRGFGKSLLSQLFSLWSLDCDVDEMILYLSAAKGRADDASGFMLETIERWDYLNHLMPGRDQRQSAVQFDVAGAAPKQHPSVRSLAINSNMVTGSRATLAVLDDIETRKNCITVLQRNRIDEGLREVDGAVLLARGEDRPPSRTLVLGTPQMEESLYHKLPDRGFKVLIYPARYPTQQLRPLYGDRLAPLVDEHLRENPELAGKPMDATRFGEEELQKRERTYGRLGFMLQFLLLPMIAERDRYPLRLSDLVVMPCQRMKAPEQVLWSDDPAFLIPDEDLPIRGFQDDRYYRPRAVIGQWVDYDFKIMAIDPAGKGRDEMGWCILGACNGLVYLLKAGGMLGGYNDANLCQLAQYARDYQVNKVIAEANFGGGMFTELFRPLLHRIAPGVGLEELTNIGKKDLRIVDAIEPITSQHRLIIDPQVILEDNASIAGYSGQYSSTYSLFHQLSHIIRNPPEGARNGMGGSLRHYDRVEALAIGLMHLMELISVDTVSKMADRREEAFEQELEDFAESCRSNGMLHHVRGRRDQQASGRYLTWFTPRR